MDAQAEEKKRSKYLHLASDHSFTPLAIEISGVIGPQLLVFLHELGRRLEQLLGKLNHEPIFFNVSLHLLPFKGAMPPHAVLGSSGSFRQVPD